MKVLRAKRAARLWWSCLVVGVVACVALCCTAGGDVGEGDVLKGAGRHVLQHDNATLTLTMDGSGSDNKGLYPPDLFSDEEIRKGAFILYLMGILYMFFALAIVCDDYFVPALEVITERLELSDDVAGATFMAAGGSAPELFTSILGEFVAKSNVGFGTIVGSAVFNVMFVIGACAAATYSTYPAGLPLTWWPLFRDSVFYATDLVLLSCFFWDTYIQWYESLALLGMYVAYVLFMSRSETIQEYVMTTLYSNQNNKKTSFASMDVPSDLAESLSPVHKIDDSILDSPKSIEMTSCVDVEYAASVSSKSSKSKGSGGGDDDDDDDNEVWEPHIPKDASAFEMVKWFALFPVNICLWLTVPNCAREEKKKFFVLAFVLSIVWIAMYSYLMVWWAEVLGRALTIPIEVMGYTLLAAGTSVPDLITSVIVARLGRGDMAVSSSIGSNIFDITFGLPVPWLLRSAMSSGKAVHVESTSLLSSVGMLIVMLFSVIISIAGFGWRLDKRLGIICFVLYLLFVTMSLLLEYEVISVKI
eukprot:TRINITY_DN12660_c0_g3_i1.p1 TRINITY_DN12660_c0_g3~~TRINITY_DN12660_c0_g3_i1.p1  ORF type:complete len:540 (+),score=153.03 TRINITY_DN12660_c0_g3_i1:30-1622(+)